MEKELQDGVILIVLAHKRCENIEVIYIALQKVVRFDDCGCVWHDQLVNYKYLDDYNEHDADLKIEWTKWISRKGDLGKLLKDEHLVDVFSLIDVLETKSKPHCIPDNVHPLDIVKNGDNPCDWIRTYYIVRFLVLRFTTRQMAVFFKLSY